MERRTALALAVAAAGAVLASSAAFAINVGLLRHEAQKPVGVLNSSVIDASFGADPSQVTVTVAGTPQTDAVGQDAQGGSSVTSTLRDHDGHTTSGAHSTASTVPGHDDDD